MSADVAIFFAKIHFLFGLRKNNFVNSENVRIFALEIE